MTTQFKGISICLWLFIFWNLLKLNCTLALQEVDINWNTHWFSKGQMNLVLTSFLRLFQISKKKYNFNLFLPLCENNAFLAQQYYVQFSGMYFYFLFQNSWLSSSLEKQSTSLQFWELLTALGQQFSNYLFLRALYMLKNYWATQSTFDYVSYIYQYLTHWKLKLKKFKVFFY